MNCCYRVIYWTYKVVFCCSRLFATQQKKRYNTVHPSKTPWLWIGAELTNGKIVTVTDTITQHIEYDDVVDIAYLESVTRITEGVSRWLYLDSKTLNEQEFPPEGILIKNDSVESATS